MCMRMKKRTLLYIIALVIVFAGLSAFVIKQAASHNKVTNAFKVTGDKSELTFNHRMEDPVLTSLSTVGYTSEANYQVQSMTTNKDPYSDAQWALQNKGSYISYRNSLMRQVISTEDVDMDILEAWSYLDRVQGEKRGVIIAIIDTGVDYQHPDLADHIWINEGEIPDDGIDNDNNGYIDDVYGWDFYNDDSTVAHYKYDEYQNKYLADPEDNDDHGTHIAGIIGAIADNGIGIAGIASNIDIKLMILKINGGPKGTGTISNAVEAIRYATMMGADICNISWGTHQYTEALREVIEKSDMLFIAAAGNSGTDNDEEPVYPANLELDNLISVSYVDADGELTDLSNYGNNTVDIAAPGEDIYSTIVGGYAAMSGSSMAVPQVSAVAALIYSAFDGAYATNVKELIINNMKPISGLSGQLIQPGIPNAYLALQAAENILVKDSQPPVLIVDTIYDKGVIRVPIEVQDEGGSGVRVLLWQSGEKSPMDFNRGMTGMLVTNNELVLDKAGVYTFYAADYTGNETIMTYEVLDDTSAPKITHSYKISDTYKTRTVTVKVKDTDSGIKRAKYMEGKRKISEFLPAGAGTEITLNNGRGTFKVKKDGIYSVYAIDNRGNAIVKQFEIRTVKATEIKLSQTRKQLDVGDEFALKTFIKPFNTTDRITFTSNNEEVATVTNSGIIKAQLEGKATITAKTSSGRKASIIITVRRQ